MAKLEEHVITDNYALYNGDSCEILPTIPEKSIHLSIYSPPFATSSGGLYTYSSDPRDLSNNSSYEKFFDHYEYIVRELYRITKPGRMTAVHCMDIPKKGANIGGVIDFPGDIIRLHDKIGFEFWTRRHIWKEPLGVRNRTMAKGLAHRQIVDDASQSTCAGADYLIQFRKKGENEIPVTYPTGLKNYAGSQTMPQENMRLKGYEGDQKKNRYSHWIWRQYASSNWDDVRIDRVLPYIEARDEEDEKHVHPLQLDVIERGIILWTNQAETVLTPFMGVGSEVYGAVLNGRKGLGIELKPSYFRQAVKNLESIKFRQEQISLF